MDFRKELLLKSAARLYSMGVDLEAAREKVKKLVEAGVPYESKEMDQAVRDYMERKENWDVLEQDYLTLRDELKNERNL